LIKEQFENKTGKYRERLRFLLGANDLFGAGNEYEWLWNVPPIKRFGWSTYIFHVTLEETNRLREREDLPSLIEEDLE